MATITSPPEAATREHDQGFLFNSDPAFICSICWQHQPHGSKPKLLVCGTKLDVPIMGEDDICREGDKRVRQKSGEWGKRGGSEDGVCLVGRSRCIGVELEEIPMCGVCGVETAGESPDRVMERGLETVTKFDGGLSRNRLDLLSEVEDERDGEMRLAPRLSARSRRFRGATKTEDGLKSFSRCRSRCHMSEPLHGEELEPLLEDAADMGIAQDGSSDGDHVHSDTEKSNIEPPPAFASPLEGGPSIVYVSIVDPAGEASFKPSKTKPLPKWMNLLPSNVHREREKRAKDEARVHGNSQELEKKTANCTSVGSRDTSPDTVVSGSRAAIPLALGQDPKPAQTDLPARQAMQTRAKISFDTIPKGDLILKNNVSRACPRSQTADSDYMTAPESAAGSLRSRPHTPFPRSPYPSASRPSLERRETSSYFSYQPRIDAQELPVEDSSCALVSQQPSSASLESPKSSDCGSSLSIPTSNVYFPSPSQSSEYIERYQPKKTPAARFEKYVPGEAGPIFDKIKRPRIGKRVLDAVEEEKEVHIKGKGNILKTTDGKLGFRIERKDLNQELKKLFT